MSAFRASRSAICGAVRAAFIKLLNVLKEMMPAVALLENVEGIERYMPKVWKALNKLKLYEILTVHVDPFCMGEPVHRPRIYFVLIRADVAVRDLDTKAALLVDAVGYHDRRATGAERIFAAHDARTMEPPGHHDLHRRRLSLRRGRRLQVRLCFFAGPRAEVEAIARAA